MVQKTVLFLSLDHLADQAALVVVMVMVMV
jgi:hypothetical protein